MRLSTVTTMLWMALLAAQAGSGDVVLRHALGPAYTDVALESACGSHVIRIHARDEWLQGRRGQILSVQIGDEEVGGAAASLQARAANRAIARIEIMNCGPDELNPLIMGVMELSSLESQREGLPAAAFFYLHLENAAWRLRWEPPPRRLDSSRPHPPTGR